MPIPHCGKTCSPSSKSSEKRCSSGYRANRDDPWPSWRAELDCPSNNSLVGRGIDTPDDQGLTAELTKVYYREQILDLDDESHWSLGELNNNTDGRIDDSARLGAFLG